MSTPRGPKPFRDKPFSSRPSKPKSSHSQQAAAPVPMERVQKVLAMAGYGSRRQIESWMQQGRITINSRIAALGDRIGANDRILIDEKPVNLSKVAQKTRVILYHKPEGEICTRDDPENRAMVFDQLPRLRNARWIMIGRLDINTSGLLLFTTEGELAHRLMHPSYNITREYAVRVLGEVTDLMLLNLKRGVELEDGLAKFSSIKKAGGEGANQWYHVILKEGRKREVRRLWESQGVQVSRLIRTAFGPIQLPRRVRQGHWAELEEQQITELKDLVKLNEHAVHKRPGRASFNY